jgi:hypothetical protein
MDSGKSRSNAQLFVLSALVAACALYVYAAHWMNWWPYAPGQAQQRDAARAEGATGLPAGRAAAVVADLRAHGLLLRDDGGRYWVSLPLWSGLDARDKERVCEALYTWRMAQGERLPVEILDAQSGRSLATFSRWGGFTAK